MKADLAIINRGFWPDSQMIGATLLRLAEDVSETARVCVITQSRKDLRQVLNEHKKCRKLHVMACRSRSDSSTGYLMRSLDALIFMTWVLVSLIRSRPSKIYVATNPPIVVPFIVFLYSRVFRVSYYYHVQDIHPEAANVVVPMHPWMFKLLQFPDILTMRHAEALITLSEEMKTSILERSGTPAPIWLVENPAIAPFEKPVKKENSVVFCGNAGRLQRIPMLLEAIRAYLDQGGKLTFTFVGAGIHSPKVRSLAEQYAAVCYHGFVDAARAAEIVAAHRWALLPIEDEVTRYAFPSKASSYVLSDCGIIAISSPWTSVSDWVEKNNLGIVCNPSAQDLVWCFQSIENQSASRQNLIADRQLKERLSVGYHLDAINEILGFKIKQQSPVAVRYEAAT
jgi:glycosyltransferase involved in cell wall biosynthesis